MKNEERAHIEVHCQKVLEDVKNNMAQMASLLKQILRARFGKGYPVSSQSCYRRQQLPLSSTHKTWGKTYY